MAAKGCTLAAEKNIVSPYMRSNVSFKDDIRKEFTLCNLKKHAKNG